MAAWIAVCCTVLAVLGSCLSVSEPSDPVVFVINGSPYPAGPGFTAVYVVSESDGTNLNMDCMYNGSASTGMVNWELIRSDFAGPVQPTPGPAPAGDPESLLIDTPDALTLWSSDGTTLLFISISPQLEGLYQCSAGEVTLRILLTYRNPYLEPTDVSIITRLVDTLSLRLVNRYADPVLGENFAPPVANVSVTALSNFGVTRNLTILSASANPNNPYETTYVVARPDDLVGGVITVAVDIGGVRSNVSIDFEVVDFFGGLMRVTVVNEGDQVMFNCTPTNPELTATFEVRGGNSELLERFPPVGNVWSFPASLMDSGFYECSAQFESQFTQGTFLLVYPNAEERDVVFYDFRESAILPDSYIMLNVPQREGLEFACISRAGSVSISSENQTLTESYTASDGVAQFNVGDDTISIIRGERFTDVLVETGFPSNYGDTLTCKSDSSSDISTLRIIPASAFVAVNSPTGQTSAVINYGEFFNISFTFVRLGEAVRQLEHNGTLLFQPSFVVDPDNNQIINYLVQGGYSTGGVYTLRSGQESLPNATFNITVTFPVLTVAEELVIIQEGENFTLTCSSSLPNLPIDWLHLFNRQSGPTISVTGASYRDEGDYRCSILEMGELTIASVTVTVDVILSCPEHFAGGILWPQTKEGVTITAPCRDADARFSDAVQVLRTCGPSIFGFPSGYATWLDPNFSGCTLSSSEPQRFVIFSLYFTRSDGTTEQSVADGSEYIQLQLDSESQTVSSYFLSSELLVVPGNSPIFFGEVVVFNGTRLRYTVNLNTSSEALFDETVQINYLSQMFYCNFVLGLTPNSTSISLGTLFGNNRDTFGFERSDVCKCIPTRITELMLPIDGGGGTLPPPDQQRRKRGVPQCVSQFDNFQEICNGTTASPCTCIFQSDCQCMTPYVGDGDYCTLDRDRDTYPEVVLPQAICEGSNDISYCQLDLCPNVPNNPASNSTPCQGFDTASGVQFCVTEIDPDWEIEWPFLEAGTTVTVPCGVNFTGQSTRMCGSDEVWEDPNVSMCSSIVFNMIQFSIALLLQEEDIDGSLDAFEDLVDATAEPLFPNNVNAAIEDVNAVLTLLEDNLQAFNGTRNVIAIFEVLDNLLIEGNIQSFEVLEDLGAGQRVLNNTERYALYVAQVLQSQGMVDTIINRTGENIVLRAQSVSVNDLQGDYVFPEPDEIAGLSLTNGSSASILLPQELLSSRGMGGNVGVASILFRNLQSFLPNDTEATHPRSLVISSQVSERGGNGEVVDVLLDNPVIITFSFEAREDEEISFDQIRCVFWDFGGNSATTTGSENVRWSSEGLRTESVTREGNNVTVTCSSNHLTSFSVLVDVSGAQIESKALSIVSYIGLAISLACLFLTIIFFITFGKKLFTAVHNFVHLNLAIALFCGYLVFAIGVELANHEKIPCNLVTALIQYFLLASFCWMMCEGIMLYLMLVVVFSTLSKKWWFFLLLGWGIPFIFVAVGLGALHEEYGVKDSSSGSDDYYKYCWLSSGKGTYAFLTFVVPMVAIIIINTVFLIMVLGSILKSRANRQRKLDGGYKVDVVVSVVKASVILLPLLGLTWVFGLFAVNENTVVFAWLFTIFNSLQGLFIFIFHVIRNDRIWGRLKKKYDSYSTSRASKSTGSTAVKSNKYHSVPSSSTGGVELKSYVEPDASEVKTDLENEKEPTKEELA